MANSLLQTGGGYGVTIFFGHDPSTMISSLRASLVFSLVLFYRQINNIIKNSPKLLEEIKTLNYKDAKESLMTLPGIGSKVADCICLFSLNHTEAFPIDTWVKQVIETLYLKREAKNIKEIETFIEKNFKTNKGLKQQYLFHYARNHL